MIRDHLFVPVFALATFATCLTSTARAQGYLFAETNSATNNEVVVYSRNAQGQLMQQSTVSTGGTGTGIGLGSQGALTMSPDLRWLFAVNAGSNDISVFRILPPNLVMTDIHASGGTQPISVTVRGDRVYVLNAGTPNNVTGFTLSMGGLLSPIAGSTQPLSAASTTPAQVELSPAGDHLVVTEKMTNLIDVFDVAPSGTLQPAVTHASSGMTPFGFAFMDPDHLIVTEAFGGATDASAVSSYQLSGGNLSTISASVPTTETAACWMAVSRDARFAYATNTGSASISGYSVGMNGQLTLLDPTGVTATTGMSPTDMAFSYRTRFLYALNSGAGTISSFERSTSGALTPVETFPAGLPAGSGGLAGF